MTQPLDHQIRPLVEEQLLVVLVPRVDELIVLDHLRLIDDFDHFEPMKLLFVIVRHHIHSLVGHLGL